MVHELPAGMGTQVTALNFGPADVVELVALPGVAPGPVIDMLGETGEGDLDAGGHLAIKLAAYEGKSLLIKG